MVQVEVLEKERVGKAVLLTVLSRAPPPVVVVLGLLLAELHTASLRQTREGNYTVVCHCLYCYRMVEGWSKMLLDD